MTAGALWAPAEAAASAGRAKGRARASWADGWDREESCPPDPKHDRSPGAAGWLSGGLVQGRAWWGRAHAKRARVVRALRSAGYHARRDHPREDAGFRQHGRSSAPSWRYSAGPLAGLEAVDPWVRARQLAACSSEWVAQPRATAAGDPRLLPMPVGCGQHHLCPVCAARRSRALASAVRSVVAAARDAVCRWCAGDEEEGGCACLGDVALVTLTHRDHDSETLAEACDRWRRAWRLTVRGRRGRLLRGVSLGYYYGIEATRSGDHWHVHAHVIVGLRAGVSGDVARAAWSDAWRESTANAAAELLGDRRFGHDPLVGCWRKGETADACRARMAGGDLSGGWWREILEGDDRALHEACKYPTPTMSLGPADLVEFLAASHGRRWHEGGWAWRSVIRDAAELADMARDDDAGDKLGTPLASLAPGDCPRMDQIADGWGAVDDAGPGVGLAHGSAGTAREGTVEWVLVEDAEPLARVWESEGWCSVGSLERAIKHPCKATDPGAEIEIRPHPSGASHVTWIRWREVRLPTLRLTCAEAARLVALTEARLLEPDDPPIDVPASAPWDQAAAGGSGSVESSSSPAVSSA